MIDWVCGAGDDEPASSPPLERAPTLDTMDMLRRIFVEVHILYRSVW